MKEIEELNPPRGEMIEYLKQAIGEGYQPEHEYAVSDLSVIDGLNNGDLNREFGKCWQWYSMGGGLHETFENGLSKSDADYRSEHLYNMKLQCLAEVLSKRAILDERGAVQDAKAINAAFDKITF